MLASAVGSPPLPSERAGRSRRGRELPWRAGLAAAAEVVLVALALLASSASAAGPVDEDTVTAVAAELRCVVCQNLSVADSPSETARQMRDIVRERLALGETPEQVMAYFVDKYGTWILLSPPRQGFTLLVWVAPFAVLLLGLAMVAVVVRRWSPRAGAPAAPGAAIDPDTQARIRREVAEIDR